MISLVQFFIPELYIVTLKKKEKVLLFQIQEIVQIVTLCP